jgi:transcriptional regulator with XRE-family HTH domain
MIKSKSPEPGLLTFGQLCKLKREQLHLTLNGAAKITGVSINTLRTVEKGTTQYFHEKTLVGLKKAYNISQKEYEDCKKPSKDGAKNLAYNSSLSIEQLVTIIDKILTKINYTEFRGDLGISVKETSIVNLKRAKSLLQEIVFVEKLL